MAINYDNVMGNLVSIANTVILLEADMAAIDILKGLAIQNFETDDETELITKLDENMGLYVSSMEQITNRFADLVRTQLMSRDTVIDELPKLNAVNMTQVLMALTEDMLSENKFVNRSIVTITQGTAVTSNSDVGELIVTKLIPGNKRSGANYPRNKSLAGSDGEITFDDLLNIVCISDSQGSTTEGSEAWNVTGKQPQTRTPFELEKGGNKGQTRLTTGGTNLLTNVFTSFTDNLPDSWTATTGSAGADFQSTTDEFLNSTSEIALQTNGAPVTLEQDLTGSLEPLSIVTMWLWVMADGAGSGTIDLNLVIDGVVTETKSVDPSAYSNWTLVSHTFLIPENLGDEVTFQIDTDFDEVLYLDGGGLSEMTYHAGIGMLMIAGQNPFIIDDYYPVTIANNDGGKIQRIFGRAFNWQLPSAEFPTIDDNDGSEIVTTPSP